MRQFVSVALLVVMSRPAVLLAPNFEERLGTSTAVGILVAVGLWGIAVIKLQPIPMKVESDFLVVFSYGSRVIFGTISASTPAMCGLIAVILTGEAWLYFVGLAVSLVANLLVFPTRSRIARVQEQLDREGFEGDLLSLLSKPVGELDESVT